MLPYSSAAAPAVALLPVAASSDLSVPAAAFQLLFSALVSLVLWRLTAWQRSYEGLEQRLNDAAGRLADERLRALAAAADAHARATHAAVDELRQRVAATDAQFRAAAERDVKVELIVAAKVEAIKDYIREFAAGKGDLERHEAAVDRRLTRMEEVVGGRMTNDE